MKKRVHNKSTGRDYKKEESYRRKTVDDRSSRNKARKIMLDFLTAKYGKTRAEAMMKGRDVDHDLELSEGGSNKISNLRLVKASVNRGRTDH